MATIPENILPQLKCSECDEYLSCGPVFLINGSENAVCGRCSGTPEATNHASLRNPKSDNQRTRCKQYEAVATLLVFPCPNAAYGCPEVLTFSAEEPPAHEFSCKFKPRVCPVLPSGQCDWIGRWNKLLQHCEEHHPNHVLQNECEMEHDITKPSLQTFLISAFSVLFLLHVKVCTSSAKIFHSIRLLNDSAKATHFEYFLNIKRDKIEFLKPGKILPADCLAIKEATSLAICINSMLNMFSGFDGTKFTISIKQLICKFCLKKGNYEQDAICIECRSKIQNCENTSKGCAYQDINNDKCKKHEWYYCQYLTECQECSVSLNGSKLFEHYESKHAATRANLGSIRRITTNYDNKFWVLSSNVGTLLCAHCILNSKLELEVLSPLSSAELRLYRCSIQIVDPQTKHNETFTIETDYNHLYDWYISINLNNFPSHSRIGLDIKLHLNLK